MNSHITSQFNIVVLIPCLNEERTVKKVIEDFESALPGAKIFVYDNNSTDGTSEKAGETSAIVRKELYKGKGNVVRRMFADIEADIYVLVDGDDTYNASDAQRMIELLINEKLDMVNAKRIAEDPGAYRAGHETGNRVLSGLVSLIFGKGYSDMLSGYRILSRRFVKSFPAVSSGFEIETELTVHALELRMKIAEIDSNYRNRPEGSFSKLNTITDGINVLKMVLYLIKEERPFQFFSLISLMLAIIAIVLMIPIFSEYLETGLVPRFPTAILSSALMILAFLSFYAGLILDSITKTRREIKRFNYLQVPIYKIGK